MSTQTSKKAHSTRSASTNSNQDEKEMVIPKPIDEKDFKKLDTDKKLEKMASALNKLATGIEARLEGLSKQIEDRVDPVWNAVFHEQDGLQPKVTKIEEDIYQEPGGLKPTTLALEQSVTSHDTEITELKLQNQQLRRELEILKGINRRQQDQIGSAKDDIVYLTSKTMAKNITISGLKEEKNENPKAVVTKFIHETLNAPLDEQCEIKIAHRVGIFDPETEFPRMMVVKCTAALKSVVLDSYKAYKESEERRGNVPLQYYVNEQLPDKIMEKQKEVRHFIWEQKRKDDSLPKDQKASIKVQNDIVYINRQPVQHKLPPVKMSEMFPTPQDQQKLDSITLSKSDDKTVKNSVFQAFAMHASTSAEAHLAHRKVRVANPSVSHVIAAFVSGENGYAFDDDGEYGSGLRLVRAIQAAGYTDLVVVVARRFGGQHIGAQRFCIINELALQAIRKLP